MAAFYVFVAVAILYAGHGALNLGQLRVAIGADPRAADLVALGLVVAGFGTKAGLMPFHGWLADAHTAAPGPVSALFSGLMVNLGVLGLARFVLVAEGLHRGDVLTLLTILGGLGALVGALLALVQDDLKRLLAYDTASQMGVLVVALGIASPESLTGMVYHLVDHALFKTLLFLCAGAVVHATGMTRLSQMGGLARHRPLVTVAFVVGVAAIAGVPPLNGYVSLGLIHHAIQHGHPVALVVLTLAQLVTVAALARATYLAFFRRRDDDYDRIERPSVGMIVAFLGLAGGCVAFGAAPGFVLDNIARPAASSLTSANAYAAAVIGHGGRLPTAEASFDYLDPMQLLVIGGTLVAGLLLAAWVVRHPDPRILDPLRALHTGSVNDYAALAVLGAVVCVFGLLLT
jgi:multicomponent Na+:H+ antiporter subunit D